MSAIWFSMNKDVKLWVNEEEKALNKRLVNRIFNDVNDENEDEQGIKGRRGMAARWNKIKLQQEAEEEAEEE